MTPDPMAAPPPGHQDRLSAAFIIIVVLVGVCRAIGLMSSAVSNLTSGHRPTKQSEVKAHLKAAFVAERSFMIEKDTYSEKIKEVDFQPERGNRYLYVFSRDGELLEQGKAPGDDTHGRADRHRAPHDGRQRRDRAGEPRGAHEAGRHQRHLPRELSDHHRWGREHRR